MPPKVQTLAIVASLGLLVFILHLIRKARLREEHALLWLLAGFCILILSAWRGSLTAIARLLDIGYAPSLLFAVGMVFTLLILLAHTAVLSNLSSHTRDLAQHLSILEWQIQHLEEQLGQKVEEGARNDSQPTEACPECGRRTEKAGQTNKQPEELLRQGDLRQGGKGTRRR
ncbi:MAG: DUF2304 domain-containing protein [Anaerolineae bacterium]